MRKLELFRAIPRPLGQYLAIGLIWPLWFLLGLVENMWTGTGAVVQGHIERGIASIPDGGWAAIGAIVVAGHWSRSKDKETKERAAATLAELNGSGNVDEPD